MAISVRVSAALLLAAVLACGTMDSSGGLQAVDRQHLNALAGGPGVHAILLFDPQDCIACTAEMPHWLELRRAAPGRVHFLLTRKPSAAEGRALAMGRVSFDGVVSSRVLKKDRRGAELFLFRSGSLTVQTDLSNDITLPMLREELGL